MAVYKKTLKGMNEMLAQSPGIHLKLFNVLVLVDGVRESAEITQLAKEADLPVDALDVLFHGGFIEKKFKGSAGLPVTRFEQSARPAAPKQPSQASKLEGFNKLYGYLVGQTKTLLGLRGFSFQLSIERATTVQALKLLIEPLTEAIAKKHGYAISQNFKLESERLAVAAIAEQ